MMRCRAPEILYEGPAGTGKTRGLLEKAHICLANYPGARVLACRKTRASMTQSVLVTFEEKVLPAGSPIRNGADKQNRSSYHYPNGSELVIGGMDNAERIMSTEYDMVLVFEATETTEDDFEKLTSRLRNGVMPYQQAVADCNPGPPSHWLNQRATQGRMVRILSRHEDNPSITPEYIERLDALTGARKERLRYGRWAAQEGLVYGFDARIHVLPAFEIPKSWRRFRVIDFGYTNPFVCGWWAMDPDGRMYLYREIYMSGRTVKVHAEQIVRLSEGESIEATICDHDAEDRATLAESGISSQPAYKAVTVGVQAVEDRLKVAGDGRPRLFVLEGCLVETDTGLAERKKPTSTREEFDGYVWPKGKDGREVKEAPVKNDDHGMDMTRYAVAYADGIGVVVPGVVSVKMPSWG